MANRPRLRGKVRGGSREPRRLPQSDTYYCDLRVKPINQSKPSGATDGLLLFLLMHISMHMTLIEYQSQRDYAREGTEYANHSDYNRKRSNMYHLPREKFPARAEYTPPFRCRGMPGNRLFKPSPAIDKAKDMAAGFLSLLYQIRQRKSTINSTEKVNHKSQA